MEPSIVIENVRGVRRSPFSRPAKKSPKSPKSPHYNTDSRLKHDNNNPMELIKRWGNSQAKSPKIRPRFASYGSFFKPKKNCPLLGKESQNPTVKDLLESKENLPISFVNENDNLASIVESLSTWRKSITTVQNSEGKLVGIIDIMDLVYVCYQRVKSSQNIECAAIECREEFQNKTAKEFFSSGEGSKITFINQDASICDLIQLLKSPNVNNVAVLKENVSVATKPDDLIAILTHTDLMSYVIERPSTFSQFKISVSHFVSHTPEKIEKDKAESKVKDVFLVASSFKTIWNKQTCGGVVCHGTSFLDKFLNWLVQIMMADLPVEDTSVDSTTPLQDVIKLMVNSSVSKVLVTNDGEILGFAEVHNIMDKISNNIEQQGIQRNI
eukprot:TRINITY_DN15119_c0_g1_i1.p1 TRINITY_DN15119_c0_g1~~TRINITY_DN15119_c0_g1_i1.p1  ORF type:complete len:403 (+),score=90.82 TRINITY_DN15119_c0_g1_i1:59-1210(+)